MAEIESSVVRVQIEGLDNLKTLIREMRIAAQEMRDAAREVQRVAKAQTASGNRAKR